MSTFSAWPGTPVAYWNANNVDGYDNARIPHAGDVSSWKIEGSGGLADWTAVGVDEPTRVRANPYMKKSALEQSVAFDGVFDQFVSIGSASLLNFIHTTGVFDFYFVVRRRSGANPRRLFGCSGGTAQRGLQVYQQFGVAGVDGAISITIGNNAGLIISFDTTFVPPIGAPALFLLRGDGAQLRLTRNFYYWQNKAFTGAVGSGNAFADYTLGSEAQTEVTPNLFEGDAFLGAIYNRNTTSAEQGAIRTLVEAQIGVGV